MGGTKANGGRVRQPSRSDFQFWRERSAGSIPARRTPASLGAGPGGGPARTPARLPARGTKKIAEALFRQRAPAFSTNKCEFPARACGERGSEHRKNGQDHFASGLFRLDGANAVADVRASEAHCITAPQACVEQDIEPSEPTVELGKQGRHRAGGRMCPSFDRAGPSRAAGRRWQAYSRVRFQLDRHSRGLRNGAARSAPGASALNR